MAESAEPRARPSRFPQPLSLGALPALLEASKPRSVGLLVATAWASMIVAGRGDGPSPGLTALALAAVAAGSAGANALTSYLDRDLDARMDRTCGRPIPTGRVRPAERALYWGAALGVAALALSWPIGPLALLLALAGILDNVLVYSLLAKRRTPWSVLWGAFSGGAPVLFGWIAVRGSLDWTPVLMALVVALWIPSHVWSLAVTYREDYQRVGIPALPVARGPRWTAAAIAGSTFLMLAGSLLLGLSGGFGPLYFAVAAASGAGLAGAGAYLALRPSARFSWAFFKLSSPYLLALFAAMALDAALAA